MDESREVYVELGRRMAALRAAQGLSQAELAQALGLKQTTYSGYESGARRLPLDKLPEVCRALGTTPGALLTGDAPEGAALTPTEAAVLEALRLCRDPAAAAGAVAALLRLCR